MTGNAQIDVLRISPNYTADDWQALDRTNPHDWDKAAKILNDRIHGRFLQYADECLKSSFSGFVVLAIDSLLLETLQQFREGIINGNRQSAALIKRALGGARFRADFDEE